MPQSTGTADADESESGRRVSKKKKKYTQKAVKRNTNKMKRTAKNKYNCSAEMKKRKGSEPSEWSDRKRKRKRKVVDINRLEIGLIHI